MTVMYSGGSSNSMILITVILEDYLTQSLYTLLVSGKDTLCGAKH